MNRKQHIFKLILFLYTHRYKQSYKNKSIITMLIYKILHFISSRYGDRAE